MAKSILLQSLLCGVVLLCCTQWAHAHGFLQIPASRNLIANRQGREYCHHCLSAGGPFTVQSLTPGGLFPNPTETSTSAVRSSLCGEAANIAAASRMYNPSPVPTLSTLPVYAPGQDFDMEVVITAHHRGHFEFRLCDASTLSNPTALTWACLAQNLLQRVAVPGEVSPVDVNHPDRYYLEPECAPDYNKTIKMKYRMPATVSCERCVMQWWWVTANTCNPPGYGNRSPQPSHVASGCDWWQSNLPVCGQSYPEEFWNCADVRVLGNVVANEPAVIGHGTGAPAPAPLQVAAPAVPAQVAPPATPATPATPVPVPPPAVPVAPGNCRPCVAADGPQCTHFGTASQIWCTGNCPTGVNNDQCPQTHCFCSSEPIAPANPPPPATPPPATPVAPPPATPVAPPPATPVAPPPATPVPPPPATPVAPPPAAPVAPPPTKPVAPPTKPAPARPAAPACAALGFQCGGQGWAGTTCCAQGSCMGYIYSYSQCRLDCPAGWLCQTQDKSMLTQAVDYVKSVVA